MGNKPSPVPKKVQRASKGSHREERSKIETKDAQVQTVEGECEYRTLRGKYDRLLKRIQKAEKNLSAIETLLDAVLERPSEGGFKRLSKAANEIKGLSTSNDLELEDLRLLKRSGLTVEGRPNVPKTLFEPPAHNKRLN